MNSPQPPAVPSASSIVQASQTANNVNQSTPLSNLNYTQGPNGQWTATQNYAPNITSGINTGLANAGNASQGANTALNNFNAQSGPANPSQAISQAVGMENQYLQPTFNLQQSNLNSQLANEGFAPGSAGYDNAQRQLQNNQTNEVAGNIAQFEPLAYQQSQTNYFDPLQAAEGNAQVGAAQLGQATGLGQLGSGSYVQTPQTDVTGAYNTQMQGQEYNYGQQVAQNNAMLGGLFSIPSAALGGWAKNGFSGLGTLASSLGPSLRF